MYCPKCGNKQNDGEKFCSNCGTEFPNSDEYVRTIPTNKEKIQQAVEKGKDTANAVVSKGLEISGDLTKKASEQAKQIGEGIQATLNEHGKGHYIEFLKKHRIVVIGTCACLILFFSLAIFRCGTDEEYYDDECYEGADAEGYDEEDGGIYLYSHGTLSCLLTNEQASSMTSLKISGYMDASDFDFIKWNCLNVEEIDLSEVVIDGYTGANGTNEGYNATYNANEIPLGAFFHWTRSYNHNFSGTAPDEGMPSIRSIILPHGITAIRRNAFARAYNLTNINIPDGVTTIDYVAFAVCRSLNSVSLPSTLRSIGKSAFQDCKSLNYVRIEATTPPLIGINAFSGIASNATLAVPRGYRDAYLSTSWRNYFSYIVED